MKAIFKLSLTCSLGILLPAAPLMAHGVSDAWQLVQAVTGQAAAEGGTPATPSSRFFPSLPSFGPSRPKAAETAPKPPRDPYAATTRDPIVPGLPQAGPPGPPPNSPFETTPDAARPLLGRLPPVEGVSSDASRATLSVNDGKAVPARPTQPSYVQDGGIPNKELASRLLLDSQRLMLRGDLDGAQQLAQQAQRLQVPNEAYGPGEVRPLELLLDIQRRRQTTAAAGFNAVGPAVVRPGETRSGGSFPVTPGVYNPNNDPTSNRTASSQAGAAPQAGVLTPPPAAGGMVPTPGAAPLAEPPGLRYYREGLDALAAQDRQAALNLFREAWKYQGQLDEVTRQRLRDKLSLLSGPVAGPAPRADEPSPLEQVDTAQQLLRQQLTREIASEEKAAEQMMGREPFAALERIERMRAKVVAAELDPIAKKQLLTLVDRRVREFRAYIDQHRSELEQDERNRAILAKLDAEQAQLFQRQDQVARLIEEYNDLIEEQRYAEAEIRAKQVRELDPDSPISRTLLINSRMNSRVAEQEMIADLAEQGFYGAMTSVERSKIPFNDENPIDFGNVKNWQALSASRLHREKMNQRKIDPTELQIQESLREKVQVRFNNQPLKEVLETLGSLTNVNIYLDPQGMGAEGVTSDTPVTINITQPISLKSALNLILEPLRLSYVIQNEVLRITSETNRDSNVYHKVYHVADLVIPIPNFVADYNTGLPAAIREAHRSLGYGGTPQPGASSALTFAANDLDPSGTPKSVLAQSNGLGLLPSSSQARPAQPLGYGAGSMGGAAMADFDTLIELITSTIAPDSWEEVGGPGAIEEFRTNLSLVISQTQDVHDQIADLLEQLRRLQDLQVTIEVRFITLRDDFYERMGVDFEFDVDDNVTNLPRDDSGNSVTIGLDPDGTPTADFDISFTQGSFNATTPAFGGFAPDTAANIGFAILSDIEAFFLLQAAQGDDRSNVLQAPKVTLFNGQIASVSDTSQRPFVTSLVPVVGDFAAAQQPVIVVLSEGTSLSVQAVVSSDRRFVRLTLVPFFSQIGDVEEFTFQGKTTTNSGTNVLDPDGNPTNTRDEVQRSVEGTTVQLPTFAFTTVSTTVSVPDGGTVLLGGIKRLREARSEVGVPMLSKIPYLNRLFKNVAIGRETQSLMLMVTPRIIIQEEEEEKLGIELNP